MADMQLETCFNVVNTKALIISVTVHEILYINVQRKVFWEIEYIHVNNYRLYKIIM